jgi:glycosyltransferase involved in cell wall biosynthesis
MAAAEACDVSVVVPLFNEETNVPLLYPQLVEVLEKLGKSFEVVFVDDGSTDGTFEELKKLNAQDSRARAISFTTNYGKSGGYAAGFEAAVGDVVITMDGDLQDDPADIPKVLAEIENGADLVVGWKTEGADAVGGKSLPSWIFNRVAQRLTQLKIHDMNCPFKAYRKHVAKVIGQEIYGLEIPSRFSGPVHDPVFDAVYDAAAAPVRKRRADYIVHRRRHNHCPVHQ